MTCHQQQIFTLLPKNQGELPAVFKLSVCKLQESDRVDVMCVQMRELLTYFLSVMRISCYEVRFEGLSTNFKAEILQKGFDYQTTTNKSVLQYSRT